MNILARQPPRLLTDDERHHIGNVLGETKPTLVSLYISTEELTAGVIDLIPGVMTEPESPSSGSKPGAPVVGPGLGLAVASVAVAALLWFERARASGLLQVEPVAEQLVPEAVPSARGGGEELLRLRAPIGQHAVEPTLVLDGDRCRTDLVADEHPQSASGRIELVPRHPIKVARPLSA